MKRLFFSLTTLMIALVLMGSALSEGLSWEYEVTSTERDEDHSEGGFVESCGEVAIEEIELSPGVEEEIDLGAITVAPDAVNPVSEAEEERISFASSASRIVTWNDLVISAIIDREFDNSNQDGVKITIADDTFPPSGGYFYVGDYIFSTIPEETTPNTVFTKISIDYYYYSDIVPLTNLRNGWEQSNGSAKGEYVLTWTGVSSSVHLYLSETIIPSNIEFTLAEATVTEKAEPALTTPSAKNLSLTYTGSQQALIEAGSTKAGAPVWQYALGKDGQTVPTEWYTTVPRCTDAGTYYVWYKIDGNDEFSDVAPDCMSVSIAPVSNVTVTITGHNNTAEYDGEEHTVTGYDVEIDDPLYSVNDFKFSGTASAARTNAGTESMRLAASLFSNTSPNFEDVAFIVTDGYQTITPKAITIKVDNKTKVYDNDASTDPALTATITGAVEGDTINYTLSCEGDQNVGDYAITVTAGVNPNYTVNVEGGTFSITPQAITIAADNKTKVYDKNASTDPALTATITGAVKGDTINYTLNRVGGQNVGNYAITVTATAGENLNYTVNVEGGTFSITPKAVTVKADDKTKVYDNDASTDPALTATITGAVKGDTINYTLSREEGQDVGNYTITATAGDNPNYSVSTKNGTFSIQPTVETITVFIIGHTDTTTYDGVAHTVTGYDVEISSPLYKISDFTFSGTAIASQTNAGTAYMGLAASQFNNTNPNFEDVAFIVTDGYQTITPKEITITADDKTTVYDNDASTDPALTTTITGAVEGDTINYTLSREGDQNVGDYAITVTAGSNPNYTVAVEGGTFSITPKPVTVKADDKTKVYDKNASTDPALTATTTGAVKGDTINYTLTRESGQDVDDYAITVTEGSNPNYTVSVEGGTFTITPKTVTVKADDKTKVYDKNASTDPTLTATITGAVEGDTINYTLSRATGQNVGEYTITVTEGKNPNYNVTVEGGTFSITPRAVTIVADNKTKVYDNSEATDPELTATVAGMVEGDTINYTLSREEGQGVGKYTITVTEGENPNYTVTVEGGTFSITPRAVTIKVDNKTKVYDNDASTDPTLTATITDAVVGDTINYTLSRATGQNVGEYTITVTEGKNPNYNVTVEGGTFSITPRAVTIVADNKTKVYDKNASTDPALTATITGAVEGDTINYTLSREEGQGVGEYAIKVTAGSNPNYTVSVEGGTFTITPKTVTVKADDKTKVYDKNASTDPALTATITGVVKGDTINYTLSREGDQNVGDYAITVTAGVNPNYTVNVEGGTFTIAPKVVTIKADNKTKVYDKNTSTDPALTATITGAVKGDTINYTLSREEGQGVGKYTIAVTEGKNPNYNVTVEGGTFSITPRAIIIAADNKTKVYDNDTSRDPTLTATITGAIEGDTINYTLTRAAGQNVGDYAITVTAGDNPNYAITAQGGTFTITPKTAIVKADDKSKTVGSADPTLTATVTGMVGTDAIVYALEREAGEAVWTYVINPVGEATQGNYAVTYQPGAFAINARPAAPSTPSTPSAPVVTYAEAAVSKAPIARKLTYNGASQALVDGGSGTGGTMRYSLSSSGAFSAAIPTAQNAGEYTVYYMVSGDSAHLDSGVSSVTVTIEPKALTVTADPKRKVAGEADPELTITAEGLLEGDALGGAPAREDGEAAGEYDITVGTLSAGDNYRLTFIGAKLTIAAAEPSPSAAPTEEPSADPTTLPTVEPTLDPTVEPTAVPTTEPTIEPTAEPSTEPSIEPTAEPTVEPVAVEGVTLAGGTKPGESATATAAVSGGGGSYAFNFWLINDSGVVVDRLENTSDVTWTFTLPEAGTYWVRVWATDFDTSDYADSARFLVSRDSLFLTQVNLAGDIARGATVTASGTVVNSNGANVYHYWLFNDRGEVVDSLIATNDASWNATIPQKAGQYLLRIYVTDFVNGEDTCDSQWYLVE